ncbi:hypothetical protein [Roseateles sp.]|uniref:hypothetical protein n=1 Tax=Roseateles sp. TaxID=1971397 RepID=UPI002F3E7B0C
MSRSSSTAMTRQQRWWIWLCVAAVMGFQALGLVHRTLHGSPAASSRLAFSVAALASAAGAAVDTSDATTDVDIAKAVATDEEGTPRFGHAAGTTDCQLLDQLSHVLGPIVQASAWAALPPDIPAGIDQPHDAMLAQQWRKGARGPPRA